MSAPSILESHAPAIATKVGRAPRAARSSVANAANEWLTFRLGDAEYGIDILRVQEIRPYEPPTRIASAADFVKGVVNLRGVIVPILDLRMKFGLNGLRYNGTTVTIVLNLGERVVGVVVDAVADVLELKPEHVKPFPDMQASVESRYITGMGALNHDGHERMLILIDIASLVADTVLGDVADGTLAAA